MAQEGLSQSDDVAGSQSLRPGERNVALKRRLKATGNSILWLLGIDNRVDATLNQRLRLRDICPTQLLSDVIYGRGQASTEQKAWLDVRQAPSDSDVPSFRRYANPLSAADLYSALNDQLFDHESKPDAQRVLIYVEDLDWKQTNAGHFVYALAETVFFSHVPTLIKAICRHLFDFNPAITLRRFLGNRVPIFELFVHLPHYIVYYPEPQDDSSISLDGPPEHLEKLDLQFLNPNSTDSQGTQYPQIYKARFTLAICSKAFEHYFAYAFADSHPNNESLLERDFPYEAGESCGIIHEDPIAGDGFGGRSLDANIPIRDVRKYGIITLYNRINNALAEWRNVVDALSEPYSNYQNSVSQPLGPKSGEAKPNKDDVKAAYNRTQQWRELVRQLLDCLRRTRRALEVFLAPDSNLWSFFVNSEPLLIHVDHEIKALPHILEELRNVEKTLEHWIESFNANTQSLQLRLTLEGNEDNRLNGFMAKLTVMLIAPMALAIGWASVNEKVVPYKLNFKAFLVTLFIFFAAVQLTVHLFGLSFDGSGRPKHFQLLTIPKLGFGTAKVSGETIESEHTSTVRTASDQSERGESPELQSLQRAKVRDRIWGNLAGQSDTL